MKLINHLRALYHRAEARRKRPRPMSDDTPSPGGTRAGMLYLDFLGWNLAGNPKAARAGAQRANERRKEEDKARRQIYANTPDSGTESRQARRHRIRQGGVKVAVKLVPRDQPNADGSWHTAWVPKGVVRLFKVVDLYRALEPFMPADRALVQVSFLGRTAYQRRLMARRQKQAA
jgi:hypothetical protein